MEGDLQVMCIDCEERWMLDYDPTQCICDDPADDAWLLFVEDKKGKWILATEKVIDDRHGTNYT